LAAPQTSSQPQRQRPAQELSTSPTQTTTASNDNNWRQCRRLSGGTSHINAATTLAATTPSLRGCSLSRAQLPFDCCVSDGEDKPGSPFAKPQVHKAGSVALPACMPLLQILAKGKALTFQTVPLIFSYGMQKRNMTKLITRKK
jgi:hypothetical protein